MHGPGSSGYGNLNRPNPFLNTHIDYKCHYVALAVLLCTRCSMKYYPPESISIVHHRCHPFWTWICKWVWFAILPVDFHNEPWDWARSWAHPLLYIDSSSFGHSLSPSVILSLFTWHSHVANSHYLLGSMSYFLSNMNYFLDNTCTGMSYFPQQYELMASRATKWW